MIRSWPSRARRSANAWPIPAEAPVTRARGRAMVGGRLTDAGRRVSPGCVTIGPHMARRPVIGVMGRGEGASPHDQALAEELGALLAARGWIVLCGGRDAGVMRAV